jgi:hypothetical protein
MLLKAEQRVFLKTFRIRIQGLQECSNFMLGIFSPQVIHLFLSITGTSHLRSNPGEQPKVALLLLKIGPREKAVNGTGVLVGLAQK